MTERYKLCGVGGGKWWEKVVYKKSGKSLEDNIGDINQCHFIHVFVPSLHLNVCGVLNALHIVSKEKD